MSPNNDSSSESPPDSPDLILTWRIHLLKRQPSRLSILILAILFGALCTAMIFRQVLPVVAVVALLLSAVSEYLLPISFVINTEGVSSVCGLNRIVMPWHSVKRIKFHRRGVLLSPLKQASRLDHSRGLWLRFARSGETGNKSEVLAVLQHYLPDLCAETAEPPATTLI